MTEEPRPDHSQLWLLAAIEKYGPCDYRDLLYDLCREHQLPADFMMEQHLRAALGDLMKAGLIQRSLRIELTDLGRDALTAARQPPMAPAVQHKRWWR